MEDNFEKFTNSTRRRALLPWWIKFFCWIFMITGILCLIVLILLLIGFKPELEIYGFDADNNKPFNSILILFTFLFHAFTAFCLWFNKSKAIFIGQIDAIWGILLCLFSIILGIVKGDYIFRIELVFLVLFYIKLSQIKSKWNSIPEFR